MGCLLILLVACGGDEVPEPTVTPVDEAAIVAVALTETAIAMPTATEVVVPTATVALLEPTSEVEATVMPTATPTATPTAMPTAETSVVAGQEVSFRGVSLTTVAAMGAMPQGEIVTRSPVVDGPGRSGVAETIRLSWPDMLQAAGYNQTATIDIFEVDEYLGLYPREWRIIDVLEQMIAERPAEAYGRYMPYLPSPGAAQVFHAQLDYVSFENGAGIRYLTAYAQDMQPPELFFYTFHGLTNDGQYYIHARLPAETNAIEFLEGDALNGVLRTPAGFEYLQEKHAEIDELTGDQFEPALSVWDDLLASLVVTPEDSFPSPGGATAPVSEDCTFDSEFVADVTIPDGSVLDGDQTVEKIWRLRNNGSCTWESESPYFVDAEGGERPMVQSIRLEPRVVAPGEETDVKITFVTPAEAGDYKFRWQLEEPYGLRGFGAYMFVDFSVPETVATEERVDETGTPVVTISENAGLVRGLIDVPNSNTTPALRIYFLDVTNSSRWYSMVTEAGWVRYENELAVGRYYVIARPLEAIDGLAGGGYTQAVICGLGSNCTDHSLVEVVIEDGLMTDLIDITDWTVPAGALPFPN